MKSVEVSVWIEAEEARKRGVELGWILFPQDIIHPFVNISSEHLLYATYSQVAKAETKGQVETLLIGRKLCFVRTTHNRGRADPAKETKNIFLEALGMK